MVVYDKCLETLRSWLFLVSIVLMGEIHFRVPGRSCYEGIQEENREDISMYYYNPSKICG